MSRGRLGGRMRGTEVVGRAWRFLMWCRLDAESGRVIGLDCMGIVGSVRDSV